MNRDKSCALFKIKTSRLYAKIVRSKLDVDLSEAQVNVGLPSWMFNTTK